MSSPVNLTNGKDLSGADRAGTVGQELGTSAEVGAGVGGGGPSPAKRDRKGKAKEGFGCVPVLAQPTFATRAS